MERRSSLCLLLLVLGSFGLARAQEILPQSTENYGEPYYVDSPTSYTTYESAPSYDGGVTTYYYPSSQDSLYNVHGPADAVQTEGVTVMGETVERIVPSGMEHVEGARIVQGTSHAEVESVEVPIVQEAIMQVPSIETLPIEHAAPMGQMVTPMVQEERVKETAQVVGVTETEGLHNEEVVREVEEPAEGRSRVTVSHRRVERGGEEAQDWKVVIDGRTYRVNSEWVNAIKVHFPEEELEEEAQLREEEGESTGREEEERKVRENAKRREREERERKEREEREKRENERIEREKRERREREEQQKRERREREAREKREEEREREEREEKERREREEREKREKEERERVLREQMERRRKILQDAERVQREERERVEENRSEQQRFDRLEAARRGVLPTEGIEEGSLEKRDPARAQPSKGRVEGSGRGVVDRVTGRNISRAAGSREWLNEEERLTALIRSAVVSLLAEERKEETRSPAEGRDPTLLPRPLRASGEGVDSSQSVVEASQVFDGSIVHRIRDSRKPQASRRPEAVPSPPSAGSVVSGGLREGGGEEGSVVETSSSGDAGGGGNQDVLSSPENLKAFKRIALDIHNGYRSGARVSSGPPVDLGISALRWDDGLASFAGEWLQKLSTNELCTIEHSTNVARSSINGWEGVPIGENLYKFSTSRLVTDINMAAAVASWYNEIECYRYGPFQHPRDEPGCQQCPDASAPGCGRCTASSHVGHFTQVMWEKTTHVGCAFAVCRREAEGQLESVLIGCEYGHAGNVIGKAPFSATVASKLKLAPQPEQCEVPKDALQ